MWLRVARSLCELGSAGRTFHPRVFTSSGFAWAFCRSASCMVRSICIVVRIPCIQFSLKCIQAVIYFEPEGKLIKPMAESFVGARRCHCSADVAHSFLEVHYLIPRNNCHSRVPSLPQYSVPGSVMMRMLPICGVAKKGNIRSFRRPARGWASWWYRVWQAHISSTFPQRFGVNLSPPPTLPT